MKYLYFLVFLFNFSFCFAQDITDNSYSEKVFYMAVGAKQFNSFSHISMVIPDNDNLGLIRLINSREVGYLDG
jgi:hypothetical protein